MSEESLTLYKLMILFMLDNLDFPLTNSQLSEFFRKSWIYILFSFTTGNQRIGRI